MTTAIRTQGLSKTYKTFGKAPVHSLRSVDLEVHENEIFGFLGRNGAGKTTAIKLLTGLIYPSSGTAALFDKDARLPEARRMVGYMPEHPYFYEYLTPHETLAFYGRLRGLDRAARDQEWDRISGLLDLRDIADRRIRSFSKGMRQRVGFAVALVGDPPLLLLDEPVSGLDPLGRRRIRELMRELKDGGKTIFFSSHVLADVEEICDRVGILVAGELAACGRIEELVGSVPKSVELRASGINASLAAELKTRVSCFMEEEAGYCRFVVPDLDSANRAVKQIQDAGGSLVYMHPVIESLEDFFTRIQEGAGVALPEDNGLAVLTSKAEE
ncbi:MAG: putative ABC transporter ATP-binding protein YxlF [Candidatus Hydrogenedentes bacterium ADurb.Bin101]|nr:MAG: putative ABC transporter ATP-binding protein YxlF [Candidatus Hydrogenedentes bacterium ADurb.Bin101]